MTSSKTPSAAEQGGALGRQLVARMGELTAQRHGALALENAARNQDFLDRGRSLAALRETPLGNGDSAVVIAAGPSLKRRDPIKAIRERNYRGCIITTESALPYCLRNGVVPDLTITLDPHATRIVRWFGDPGLDREALEADDYYRRQDMDDTFANEVKTNREVLSLLDRHGKDVRIALATSASEAVVRRVIDTGMKIFWWNPMLDDPDEPGSVTADLQRRNGLPCVNAGGNVGTAAWMMAGAVLGKQRVAVTGMDFGYYDDTPYKRTQYYNEILDCVGEAGLDTVFMRVYNPHIKAWFYTDPAYMWYREAFLEMAADADYRTYNCTGGGILFGGAVESMGIETFLDRFE